MTRHDKMRAERVYDAIVQHFMDYGHAPSVRQLLGPTGLASTAAVHHHIRALVDEGRLHICKCGCGRPNAYELVEGVEVAA